MTDEITFMDLAALLKITQNITFEKLGSALNASIFDASNIAGTLKQKGFIEFTTSYPGPNTIKITDSGQALLKEADSKSEMAVDPLDESILTQMSGGKRLPVELQNTLNVRPKDLAMRLYKLNKQNLLIYELRNGGVELLLTEKGFLLAKSASQRPAPSPPPPPVQTPANIPPPPTPQATPPPPPQQPRYVSQQTMQQASSPSPQPQYTSIRAQMPSQPRYSSSPPQRKRSIMPIIAIILIIILVLLYLYDNGMLSSIIGNTPT